MNSAGFREAIAIGMVLFSLAAAGCHRRAPERPVPSAAKPSATASAKPSASALATASERPAGAVAGGATASAPRAVASGSDPGEPEPRPLRRCFPDQPAWVDAPVSALLDAAADLFDAGDFGGALACAEEAARQTPRSVEAHHNRAIALIRLDRLDEARDALALALALAPDDPETLEAAADLNINQLPPSADRSALGLEYARRGSRRVTRGNPGRIARLALLEGQALIDLGRATEALRRIEAALRAAPGMVPAAYERGVALFELCRFEEARRMFEKVLVATPEHAHALYHLGLIEERANDQTSAARHLAAASGADPKSFPVALDVPAAEFATRVRHAYNALPEDVRRDLAGVKVETADLPAASDLTAERPPLSPTILGLFRGLPLDFNARLATPTPAGRSSKGRPPGFQAVAQGGPGAPGTPVGTASGGAGAGAGGQCDATSERVIVLYRRNLLRTVRDRAELDQAISRTLLHEVGHLRGEDDGSLRDRGLE